MVQGGAISPTPSFLLFCLLTGALPARKPSAKARMDLVSDRSSFRTSTWEFFVSARISLAADSPFSTSRQAIYTRAPGAKTKTGQCVQTEKEDMSLRLVDRTFSQPSLNSEWLYCHLRILTSRTTQTLCCQINPRLGTLVFTHWYFMLLDLSF